MENGRGIDLFKKTTSGQQHFHLEEMQKGGSNVEEELVGGLLVESAYAYIVWTQREVRGG